MLNENVSDEIKVEENDSEDSSYSELEWLAPEGGWGYMVCIGLSILFIVVSAPSSLFGLIFKDFFEDIEDGTSGITLVNGVYNAVVSFTGFLTTSVFKRFSLRQCGLIGAAIFVLGSFLTIFATSITYLVFTVGILQGIGFGIMVPTAMTSFNNYFVKKRAAFMSLSSIIVGIGFMLCPYIIKYCKENYGLKGTLMILCGMGFHTFFSMAVMQPAQWHLVPQSKSVSATECCDNSLMVGMVIENIDENTNRVEEKNSDDPFIQHGIPIMQSQTKIPILNIKENRLSINFSPFLFNDKNSTDVSNLTKTSSLASIGNWTGTILASETLPVKDGTWRTILNLFDLKLLKDPKYSNICFGVSFAFFSEITFFILVPVLLYHYNFTPTEVALCMTVAATADLISRIILTVFTFYYTVSSRLLFYSGTFIIVILRNIFFQFDDFYHVTIFIGLLGFFRSWLHVPLPLVFAEYSPSNCFSTSYGLFMMISGVITLVLSLIIGLLEDYTNNYMITFHLLTVCSLVLVIPWTIEFYFTHRNKKNRTK